MKLILASEPGAGDAPHLDYSWDADTGILGARFSGNNRASVGRSAPQALSNGIVQVTAPDGAWLHFEVADGRMAALEIAIWPELLPSRAIRLPDPEDGYAEVRFMAPDRQLQAGAVLGITLPVQAQPDYAGRIMQLRFGSARSQRAVRAADGLLIATDSSGQLASLWLLKVPGFAQSSIAST